MFAVRTTAELFTVTGFAGVRSQVAPASVWMSHVKERSAWFLRGRVVPTKPSAALRRQAPHYTAILLGLYNLDSLRDLANSVLGG
jgi:hypothetical protein